jgi:type IV pilus assembly protein PilB
MHQQQPQQQQNGMQQQTGMPAQMYPAAPNHGPPGGGMGADQTAHMVPAEFAPPVMPAGGPGTAMPGAPAFVPQATGLGGQQADPALGFSGSSPDASFAAPGTAAVAAQSGSAAEPALGTPQFVREAPAGMPEAGAGGTLAPGTAPASPSAGASVAAPPSLAPSTGAGPARNTLARGPIQPGGGTGSGPPPLGSGAPMGSGLASPPPTNADGGPLRGATAMQLQGKRLRIGEVLIDMGMIDQGQLDHALSVQRATGVRLGKVLIQEGMVTSTDIARALARRLSIEFVDLADRSIPDDVIACVPHEMCTRYQLVPIQLEGNTLFVAMGDPTNVFALDDIRLASGKDIRVVVASPESIDLCHSRMISLDQTVTDIAAAAKDWDEDYVPLDDIKDSNSDAPAIQLVNQIISKAVMEGVSDLHFEPQAEDMVIRFRKDGVLQHVTNVPGKLRAGVTSRIKIMASLDISERRKPQDGRVPLLVGDKPIDLRVATLPTVYGEKSVMRVLDKSNVMLTMDQLAFLPDQLKKLRYCYTQPYGCLLVTGPTGSGKSTTLYGALNEVNDVEKNIITVEDPVEYRLKGINQVQVNVKAGLTFASALRSILRCDPDIVMIGEMRDHETASIGVEAALTGHLVLSTLHTNTAPGALTRLTEMGMEPYLVSSSVLGVLAQRLARRLCTCAEEWTPDAAYLRENNFPDEVVNAEQMPTLRRPIGCNRCDGKGYKGRVGIHEVMLMSEEIAQAAIVRASAEEMAKIALDQGMIDLWHDGVAKVLMGITSIEELQRVVSH